MTTNMLTWEELERHRDAGQIARWTPSPTRGTGPNCRCLYMVKDIHDAFQKRPWPETQTHLPNEKKNRRQAMRAVLERFVVGQRLNLEMDMKELGSLTKNSSMRGFWEFRSGGQREQTRLFGFFARGGAFVATSFKARGSFGGIADPAWLIERELNAGVWASLFGSKQYLATPWPVATREQFALYLDHGHE